VIEIHTLSSPPLVELLLAELLRRGARLARPGEFTLRAFLNGKLDLTRAEAIRGVIEASDFEDLKPALAQLAGGVATPLQELRASLLHLLAEVEAGLDFAEEDLHFISSEHLLAALNAGARTLEGLLEQLRQRAVSGRPFRVVLTGLPNAGKSSLFNALCGRDTALVSPEPGTTRDYLEQRLQYDGIEIELVDTAGAVEIAVEAEITTAAQRGRQEQVERAELLLHCVDAVGPPPDGVSERPHVTVLTKCDLLPEFPGDGAGICTSARTGFGLPELKRVLAEHARQARRPSALAPSVTRCQHHVKQALEHVRQARGLAKAEAPPELLALELRLALDQVGEMVGAVYTEGLLDRIFGQFCIGK
jgi:tRNA modification GTPase